MFVFYLSVFFSACTRQSWIVERLLKAGSEYMFPVSECLMPPFLKKIIRLIPVSEKKLFIAGSYPSAFFDPDKTIRECNDIDIFCYSPSLKDASASFRCAPALHREKYILFKKSFFKKDFFDL